MLLVVVVLPLYAGSVTRTATFDRNDLSVYKSGTYDVVELRGCLPLVSAGEPRLPHVIQSVAIPAGALPTGVELKAEEWIDLPGIYQIVPAQPDVRLPKAGETFRPTLYPPDPKIYGSANPWPEVKTRLLQSGTMSGYRIANIDLLPVRYVPTSGKLQMATRLSYRLSYTENATHEAVATRRQLEAFGDVARRLVVNPEDVDRYAPEIR